MSDRVYISRMRPRMKLVKSYIDYSHLLVLPFVSQVCGRGLIPADASKDLSSDLNGTLLQAVAGFLTANKQCAIHVGQTTVFLP